MTKRTTQNIYAKHQRDFRAWCDAHGIPWPAENDAIAEYLLECLENRSANVMMVISSALASLYREEGLQYDTKHGPVAQIMSIARDIISKRSAG